MYSVGLKVLKNKLSEYVRLASGGEVVLVTDRDRVVAELIPPRSGRAETIDDVWLASAVREGLLSPPAVRSSEPPPKVPIDTWDTLRDELASDRADR